MHYANNYRNRRYHGEGGNAQVEFLGVVIALVVPVLYLIVSISHVQAANLAVTSAAQTIARAHALGAAGGGDAQIMASLALEDQGFDVTGTSLDVSVDCVEDCSGGDLVASSVDFRMSVPGLGWSGLKPIKVRGNGYSYIGELRSEQ